jgi:hypothetical protein
MDRVRAAGGAANCGVAEAKHSPPQTTTVRVDRMLNRLLCVLRVSSESPLESHTVEEARWQVEARGGQENCNKVYRRSYAGSLSDGESPVSGASIAGRRADGPIRWSSSSSSSSADAAAVQTQCGGGGGTGWWYIEYSPRRARGAAAALQQQDDGTAQRERERLRWWCCGGGTRSWRSQNESASASSSSAAACSDLTERAAAAAAVRLECSGALATPCNAPSRLLASPSESSWRHPARALGVTQRELLAPPSELLKSSQGSPAVSPRVAASRRVTRRWLPRAPRAAC